MKKSAFDRTQNTEWIRLIYQAKIKKGSTTPSDKNLSSELSPSPGQAISAQSCFELLDSKYGLTQSLQVLCIVAENHYYMQRYTDSYGLTTTILANDPFQHQCLPIHLCSLVELDKRSELFYTAHKLVDAYPALAISWFAVGCYYYAIRRMDQARKFFSKATSLDNRFLSAWIGVGNSFAATDECDQAMLAYRTALRLFSGYHIPALFIGMEYYKTSNLTLAEQFVRQAMRICPSDPLVHNELGVICFKNKEFEYVLFRFAFVYQFL